MIKRLLIASVAVVFFTGLSFAAGSKAANAASKMHSYVGVITDSHCGVKGHMGSAAECVKGCVSHGAKYALAYHGKAYIIEPQELAASHPGGSKVLVKGSISGDTIQATSIVAAK